MNPPTEYCDARSSVWLALSSLLFAVETGIIESTFTVSCSTAMLPTASVEPVRSGIEKR